MAQDIIGGLFGITPEMYQQNKQQQQIAEAIKMGSLTPEQFVGTQAYRGGQAAGNVLGGLMGVEDPQLQAIRGAQSVVSKYDINSSAGLKRITQELQQLAQSTGNNAYMTMAQDAANRYRQVAESEATIGQKRGENLNTSIASGKLVPASVAKYKLSGNPADLEYIDKGLSGANLEKVASAEKANESLSLGNADIAGFLKDLKEGNVVYGPVSNVMAKGSSAIGYPTDNALKQQEIESFITGSINDVLNSAKGVQAKDDAIRAERQIKGYLAMNSNEGVEKALKRLQKVKEDTIKSNQIYIDVLTKGKGSGLESKTTGTQHGQYAEDYAKYKEKYGSQAMPYEAYVQKRSR